MSKIVSVVNLKGGVGKTAIAVNFAAYCGSIGKKTLLIDLDPQTNATFSCISVDQWEQHSADHGTVANLLGFRNHTRAEDAQVAAEDVIYTDVFAGVDLLPSHLDLFTVDLDFASATARETKLRRAIQPILDNYEGSSHKSVRRFGHGEVTHAEVEIRDEGLGGPESVGPVAYHFGLVV